MATSDRNDWKARIDRALSELKSTDGPALRGGRDEKRATPSVVSESSAR